MYLYLYIFIYLYALLIHLAVTRTGLDLVYSFIYRSVYYCIHQCTPHPNNPMCNATQTLLRLSKKRTWGLVNASPLSQWDPLCWICVVAVEAWKFRERTCSSSPARSSSESRGLFGHFTAGTSLMSQGFVCWPTGTQHNTSSNRNVQYVQISGSKIATINKYVELFVYFICRKLRRYDHILYIALINKHPEGAQWVHRENPHRFNITNSCCHSFSVKKKKRRNVQRQFSILKKKVLALTLHLYLEQPWLSAQPTDSILPVMECWSVHGQAHWKHKETIREQEWNKETPFTPSCYLGFVFLLKSDLLIIADYKSTTIHILLLLSCNVALDLYYHLNPDWTLKVLRFYLLLMASYDTFSVLLIKSVFYLLRAFALCCCD